jgi:hypothetical protein
MLLAATAKKQPASTAHNTHTPTAPTQQLLGGTTREAQEAAVKQQLWQSSLKQHICS